MDEKRSEVHAGKEINYWAGGFSWGDQREINKKDEFITNGFWEIGYDRSSTQRGAKDAWENFDRIQPGDELAFKGYGGRNDLVIHYIAKVIEKDNDSGKLLIEKIDGREPYYHGKAPKLDKGGFFGTLNQVSGDEAINKIFFNSSTAIDSSVKDFINAFEELDAAGELKDYHKKLLRCNCAENLTAGQLAQKVGLANYQTVNLWYGSIAKLVCQKLSRTYQYHLSVLVEFDEKSDVNGHTVLKMHDVVKQAVRHFS